MARGEGIGDDSKPPIVSIVSENKWVLVTE
jgi:hypothetical protein